MAVEPQSWLHNLDDEHGYFVSDTDTGLTMHFCDGEANDGLVLDTRLEIVIDLHTELEMQLQAITNAWNSDSFMPHRSWIRGKFPQLSAAIDNALTEEVK